MVFGAWSACPFSSFLLGLVVDPEGIAFAAAIFSFLLAAAAAIASMPA